MSNPIKYSYLVEKEEEFLKILSSKFSEELDFFKWSCELYISVFSNSQRTYREYEKVDYLQLVAVRLFHEVQSALKLALTGYFPQSAMLNRGVVECLYLIYDFKVNPDHEDVWFDGSARKRKEMFKVGRIRERLKEKELDFLEYANGLYNLLSKYATHLNRESCLWYLEVREKKQLFYHWAGRNEEKRSTVMILSAILALSCALMILVEEDIYTFNDALWVKEYYRWKEKNLEVSKKFGKYLGSSILDGVSMPESQVVV